MNCAHDQGQLGFTGRQHDSVPAVWMWKTLAKTCFVVVVVVAFSDSVSVSVWVSHVCCQLTALKSSNRKLPQILYEIYYVYFGALMISIRLHTHTYIHMYVCLHIFAFCLSFEPRETHTRVCTVRAQGQVNEQSSERERDRRGAEAAWNSRATHAKSVDHEMNSHKYYNASPSPSLDTHTHTQKHIDEWATFCHLPRLQLQTCDFQELRLASQPHPQQLLPDHSVRVNARRGISGLPFCRWEWNHFEAKFDSKWVYSTTILC